MSAVRRSRSLGSTKRPSSAAKYVKAEKGKGKGIEPLEGGGSIALPGPGEAALRSKLSRLNSSGTTPEQQRRLTQRRRDRRITRAQRRTLRDRREKVEQEENIMLEVDAQKKEVEASYISDRRKILRYQFAGSSALVSKLEHPSLIGYTAKPTKIAWDARVAHPLFFGYKSQRRAEDTIAVLDVKLFGVAIQDWDESLERTLVRCTELAVASAGLPATAVRMMEHTKVSGKNMRRVVEKVERRANTDDDSVKHLANLLRANGGALNVKVAVVASGTAEALLTQAHFRVDSPRTRGHRLPPRINLDAGVADCERAKAEVLCQMLDEAVSNGEFGSNLMRLLAPARAISVALNFAAQVSILGRADDYSIKGDTPRKRRTRARELGFQLSAALQARRPDPSEREALRTTLRPDAAISLHPAFIGRRMQHDRRDVRVAHPLFWGSWSRPQVPVPYPQLHAGKSAKHPVLGTVSDWAKVDKFAHLPSGAGIEALRAHHTDASSRHPVLMGRMRCKPNQNSLQALHADSTRPAEAEKQEDLDDEKFVLSLGLGQGHTSLTPDRPRADVEEEVRIQALQVATRELNVHPGTRGYATRDAPLFAADAVKRVHPSCLGYDVGLQCRLPPYALTTVVHPACVGYELACELMQEAAQGEAAVNPTFFGLALNRGPRYQGEGSGDVNTVSQKRQAHLAVLATSAGKDGPVLSTAKSSGSEKAEDDLCRMCFGEKHGCPKCWRPESWELAGIESGFEEAASDFLTAIMDNPNLGGGHKSRRRAQPNEGMPAPNTGKNGTGKKLAKDSRTTMKLKLKAAAKAAFKQHATLASVADILLYRTVTAAYTSFRIKSLPTGNVTLVRMERFKTVRDLVFAYRSNAPSEVGNLQKVWLLLPTASGMLCLDDTMVAGTAVSRGFSPGAVPLEYFGFDGHGSAEVCLFQVKHLRRPSAIKVVKSYIGANVDLNTPEEHAKCVEGVLGGPLSETEAEGSEQVGIKKGRRFGGAVGSTVAIKAKMNVMRIRESRGSNAGLPEQVKPLPTLDAFRFTLLHRADQLGPCREALYEDELQVVLVREMKELDVRQREVWAVSLVQRETLVAKTRAKALLVALLKRRQREAPETGCDGTLEQSRMRKTTKTPKPKKKKSPSSRDIELPRISLANVPRLKLESSQ